MLRLSVEGPEEEVRAFLKDFALLPQHRILATSAQYLKKGLGTSEIQMNCSFVYYPLKEINEPITVMFRTTNGKHLCFTLLKGNVIRDGNRISINGEAASGLLE
ncbi:hypothetical protein [Lihuaxuella thermophila]|uniref:Uncharacterized protein n=1 Tax=Lihuaxuella thermophila TaxID=1173111 RepID=A0A1H8J1L7_9BACL|nr:hypothetical protein [Lihuaxuella thermophila]SEN74714.1 hypothetical protein SAMN05444955_1215 [Lihuaxuella thermophila]